MIISIGSYEHSAGRKLGGLLLFRSATQLPQITQTYLQPSSPTFTELLRPTRRSALPFSVMSLVRKLRCRLKMILRDGGVVCCIYFDSLPPFLLPTLHTASLTPLSFFQPRRRRHCFHFRCFRSTLPEYPKLIYILKQNFS